MKSIVKKSGKSVAIRIPTAVMKAIALEPGEIVDVRAEAGRIVIQPVRKRASDIRTLIKAIARDNLHEAADFGPPAGKEVW